MDEIFMKRALELALEGAGRTNPNPLVGAVIVKDGEIVGEGYHKIYGDAHAEVNAIRAAGRRAEGATLYVNLEPCCHYGKTPPCTEALIDASIKRVVVAMRDPNPLVDGKGIARLKEAGIEVSCGVLEEEAKALNEIYIKFITTHLPFVILKAAMSLDGKICTSEGDSKWISSETSRAYVHSIRNRVSAVMVGLNTVIADNPHLTTRIRNGRDARPVIVDSLASIPISANVLSGNRSIVVVTERAPIERVSALKDKGAEVIFTGEDENGMVDLNELMYKLGDMGIDSILLEGGGSLNWSAVKKGIVDKFLFFVAPVIIGGASALTPVEGEGFKTVSGALRLKRLNFKSLSDDILIEGYPERR
ncbi:MAG: bifunctional diaminohydroxyphosphoribosylaminopyrimidine deaminase/5-amino-6-(5-phosphoribosylamino)uracil reductase RibD [Thermoanaerobacteraceae bacterium]|nr:bifunctional diaminohydroxyphosphoribosylaminopyrimidine deaminase/5-amino-6-(5-phosphoribosylamino)uracil reductase RibD [Thermoanaerobacteraceae bacterium]